MQVKNLFWKKSYVKIILIKKNPQKNKWTLEKKNHVDKIQYYFVIGCEKLKSWKIHFEEKKISQK